MDLLKTVNKQIKHDGNPFIGWQLGNCEVFTDVNGNIKVRKNEADKAAKVDTAKNLWVPAVNNHGGFGRWAFIEIRDPWTGKAEIREFLENFNSNTRELEDAK